MATAYTRAALRTLVRRILGESQVADAITRMNPEMVQTITSATRSAGVATITTSLPHGYGVGDRVSVANCTVTAYNGTWTVATAPTATTFTFALAGSGDGSDGQATGLDAILNRLLNEAYSDVAREIEAFRGRRALDISAVGVLPFGVTASAWALATPYLFGDYVTSGGKTYLAIYVEGSWTSTADDEPGVGSAWATYWQEATVVLPIPADLVRVERVAYVGSGGGYRALEQTGRGTLEAEVPDWPYATAGYPAQWFAVDGRYLAAYPAPSKSDTGVVYVQGLLVPSSEAGGVALLTSDASVPAFNADYHKAVALAVVVSLAGLYLGEDPTAQAAATQAGEELKYLIESARAGQNLGETEVWAS